VINFISGFIAKAGNFWDLLYSSAITGWETLTVSVFGLGPNQTYAFSYVDGAERLTIYSVPEPDSRLLLALGFVIPVFWRGIRAWQ
jgi:hypothetical protein